jgi:hypothetical protein
VAHGGVLHQIDGGAEEDAERALSARHERGDIEAALREQVLQAVAGHLATERAHLRAHRPEPVGDDMPEAFHRG